MLAEIAAGIACAVVGYGASAFASRKARKRLERLEAAVADQVLGVAQPIAKGSVGPREMRPEDVATVRRTASELYLTDGCSTLAKSWAKACAMHGFKVP